MVDIYKGESSLAVPVCFHFASPVMKTTRQVDYCLINLMSTSINFSCKHVIDLSKLLEVPVWHCCHQTGH